MTPRITALDPAQADGQTAELFTAVKATLGVVPNLMRTFGHSPAALEAYLGFGRTLATGVLSAQLGEQIALTVAQANGCDYCLAAHTLLGKSVGLAPAAIADARRAKASEVKAEALLRFAHPSVETRGRVSDQTLAAVRAAGTSDAEIVETIAHVAVNILTTT